MYTVLLDGFNGIEVPADSHYENSRGALVLCRGKKTVAVFNHYTGYTYKEISNE